jgi:transposase InsO family protein
VRLGDHPAQPGLGDGHHVHPDGAWLRLPGCGGGLVQPPGTGVEAVDHAGQATCLETLEEALHEREKPEIFNTDQGSQFTSVAFTRRLKEEGISISMDGRGRWRDNVFIEPLWRSIQYEEVYLRAYASIAEARASLGRYLEFYNSLRPHSSLAGKTPDQVHFNRPLKTLSARM